ncbi:hypothetical protein [Sphingobium sp. HDIP04]|uniref:hypothetical protein n=1 Tax=Sphingobium sp. HDIP04 TaxID=428994 RepID=UPI0003876875|nr:hypothetical protein [Sphingobium sp. HDIP04]EQB03876.1 hypothetical protein L286_10960 [Sphingobium sp. HDIP04]
MTPDIIAALQYARNLIGPDEIIDAALSTSPAGQEVRERIIAAMETKIGGMFSGAMPRAVATELADAALAALFPSVEPAGYTVPGSVYEAAVKGRQDFRDAYREQRDLLTPEEWAVVEQLGIQQELSVSATLRQAVRLYQVHVERIKAGETVSWSGDAQRARDFSGPLAVEPAGNGREAVAWRCFHCGETFTDAHLARLHFGRDETSEAACIIKAGAEGSLLKALRDAEEQADDAIQRMHDESTDAAKAFHQQRCRHNQALIAAEEAGYEKGLADGGALATPPAPALDGVRAAADTLRKEAFLLLQNSEGCALNHYGHDAELFGMPGWLVDSRARIEAAAKALSSPSEGESAPASSGVERDFATWLRRYVGKQDAGTMRFSVDELRLAFTAGQAAPLPHDAEGESATVSREGELREVLETIANAEFVDVMCDPGWAIRLAKSALSTPATSTEPDTRAVCEQCGKLGAFFCDHVGASATSTERGR